MDSIYADGHHEIVHFSSPDFFLPGSRIQRYSVGPCRTCQLEPSAKPCNTLSLFMYALQRRSGLQPNHLFSTVLGAARATNQPLRRAQQVALHLDAPGSVSWLADQLASPNSSASSGLRLPRWRNRLSCAHYQPRARQDLLERTRASAAQTPVHHHHHHHHYWPADEAEELTARPSADSYGWDLAPRTLGGLGHSPPRQLPASKCQTRALYAQSSVWGREQSLRPDGMPGRGGVSRRAASKPPIEPSGGRWKTFGLAIAQVA